ncbi:response regulator [Flavobacterium sedimenticola]|uniref:histidine kinase n=1 Tax=Flavobacterium sedimenticola TaxID=3043286 RepID=A0ABT6XPZ9_9FLAO|nr:response regulator [Flavobacterium sedimenticola]MDI9257062.1 response regulator [Flavobacterium sedimenticola]
MNKEKLLSLLLVLLCSFFSSHAQDKKAAKAQIKKLIDSAVVDFSKSEYDKALEHSKKALVQSFAIDDHLLIAQSYNTIGVIFNECSESAKAIEFYNKALVYTKKVNNDKMFNWIYSNLGSVYYFNDIDVPKGINYYKKALYYAVKIKDTAQIEYTKLNLASAYFAIKKYDLGNKEINDVKQQIFEKGSEEAKMSLHLLLGIYDSNNNQKQSGEQHYFEAKRIAEQNQFDSYLINIYENLVRHYKLHNDLPKSQLFQQKLDSLNKVVYSEDKIANLKKAATQIELQEYKIQLAKIESENEKHQKILKESKLIVILFIVILIILLLLLLTLYKNMKLREQANYELKEANEALIEAKEKAEEASQLKSQFVSTITHELRTPLYGVIGITNIITDEHKELVNSPHLKSLKFSAKYLLSLVNDILQINKIEEKRVVLENHIFNIADEITTIQNSVEYIADKNNNKLTIEIDTAIPEFLIGDKLRLSQIIMNLVSNALKFTKNGEVTLTADLKEVVDKTYFIEFKVKDTGVGIAKEDQDKIFDKFVQIERKEEDYQGTGLGLSIVSRLIQLFDSEIHLESEENVGTTFYFTIGFEYDAQKSQEIINNIEVDLSDAHLCNILVVEDNKINQMVTKKIIQNSNMTCTIVDDGYAAIVALERERFDLILMDINMPLINGFETTRKIREKGIDVPVIALTAFDKQEVTEEALSAGMNDIMVKPFEPSKLFQVISNNIKNKESVD